MAEAATRTTGPRQAAPALIGEWFWRFLAAIMLAIVGWVVWIAIQISPPDLILPEAFEAAAQGRAARNSAGVIGSAPLAVVGAPLNVAGATTAASVSPVVSPAVAPIAPAAEAPVNLEKLRLAGAIETPIVERPRRAAKPAEDATR